MDRFTLAVANLLFFLLYTGLVLVIAKLSGGRRGATWFAAANAVRAGAVASMLVGQHTSEPWMVYLGAVLMVAGMAMLHRSFAEMVDRGRLLWRLQILMVALAAGGMVYLVRYPTVFPAGELLTNVLLGVQAALAASVLFSFAGEGVVAAGWFTGVSLALYGLLHMMRVAETLRFGTAGYVSAIGMLDRVVLLGMLVMNAAVAFGFVLLTAAKQRLELLWRAQVDELTGLLNRGAMQRIAKKEIFRSRRTSGQVALLVLDLDGFKGVNDSLGHACGDAVLRGVGDVLQRTLRAQDSAARMGGDEFCVLLPDTDLREAMTVAERLRTDIESLRVRYREHTLTVRTSIGVSCSEQAGLNWQVLVEQADAALYQAKRFGKNRVATEELGAGSGGLELPGGEGSG